GRFFLVQLSPEDFRRRLRDRHVQQMGALSIDQRSFCLKLQKKLASGDLKTSVVHGDTKLDNFLFSTRTGRVKSLVDLDTVMPHTWLSDWGDMARSLVNVSGERERNPDGIRIDMEVFKSIARGFIRSAPLPPRHEMELMLDAARIMAMELGIRFLADYLRGDTYFRLGAGDPVDLNRIRASVQFSVFRSLGDRAPEAMGSIIELYEERKKELEGRVSP
ncbi:MAG: phosphotransferase, partial [Acidobacteria bacterium]|nr:phosphotransferase [Acidobacteriota bacterium]